MSSDLLRWLDDIGLGQYAAVLAENDVDISVLPDVSDEDLKELGMSLGHRRRLQRAIAERQSRRTGPTEHPAPASAAGEPLNRNAERRQLTVLFCDLVGSTELSGRYDPEELRELLRRYQDAVSGAVVRFGGYVANFSGDGIIAYFGWPWADEDGAAQAVRAGLDVVAAVIQLSLQSRVGIASGMVVVGDLDAAGRRQIAAIAGETPNVAARLQSFAGPDQVVIAGLARQLLGAAFLLEDLGAQYLKGIAEPILAWRVIGERTIESRFEGRGGALVPFIGREQEMALLIERFERAASGEGQAILLSGEAGIGKSHLIQTFHDRLASAQHGPVRVRMQCAPMHTASALQPVIRHLRYAAGFLATDGPEERLDKLELLLRQAVEDIGRSAALLAPLLSLPGDRYGALTDLTPEQLNDQLMRALIDQLLGRARHDTVLLVLEDVHWIDAATRDLFERLLPSITSARILVLITHRPELQLDWGRHPHVTSLSLNRLSRSQGIALVRAAGGAPFSEEIVALIGERAGGVPLFIEELTKSALESKKGSNYGNIPETLQASLLSRLDRLGSDARELAQVAAVIGREFEVGLLRAVADQPSDTLAGALERLIGAQIVLPAGAAQSASYVFRHALIQEAAYQSLLLSRRRRLHSDVARALETGTEGDEPEIIAQHYTAALLPKQAVPHWLRAGKRALAHFVVATAVAHFERGLQLARPMPEAQRQLLDLLLALGDALVRTVRLRDALATFMEAASLAREVGSPDELAQAALGVEDTELHLGGGERASVELLDEALVALGPVETEERCRVLSQLGRALLDRGEINRANALSLDAIGMARRLGNHRALYDALLCERAARTGHPYPASQFPQIRGILDEMLAAAEEIGDPTLLETGLAHVVPAVLEMGDGAALEAILARHDDSIEHHHMDAHRYFNVSAHAMQAILHGEFAEAERLAELAFDAGREFTSEFAAGVHGVQMFTIRREQGRLAEVAPLLRRFVDGNSQAATWRPGMALIASDLGFHEAARKAFEDMATDGFVFPLDAKFSLTMSYLAEVCARLDDTSRAEHLYDRLLPYRDLAVIAPATTVCCGAAARYLGMLAGTLGEWAWAETHFEAALDMDERLRAWPWLAHTKHEFAVMLRARGQQRDRDRADSLLSSAAASAERLGMRSLQEKIQSLAH